MYFLILDELTQSFWSGVRTLFYSICTLVYKLIIYLYNLFDMLSRGRIIDSDFMNILYSRIGLILGLLMFFKISFSFIQMLVNPDTITDKEKGTFNIIKRVLISVVLLGVVPYMFELGYKVQNILLGSEPGTSNVISRLLLPVTIDNSNGRFGEILSEQLFFAFYDLDTRNDPEAQEYQDCVNYQSALKNEIENTQEFSLGYNCLNQTMEVTDPYSNSTESVYVMRFDYLFSLIAGLFVCWFLLMYCFSVGVRVIQLAFLQIIAPMPIVSYISPKKDGMFSKWGKMCLTTYLDVFIRVAIINFVVLLIAMIMDGFFGDVDNIFLASTGAYAAGKWYQRFLFVIIVLSLLQFAKKAPELLKELLPKSWAASGDFGFGLKGREFLGKGLATATGIAAGGVVGLMSERGLHRLSGGAVGMARGLSKGIMNKGSSVGDLGKNMSSVGKNQFDYNKKHIAYRNNDSTFLGRLSQRGANWFGVQGQAELMENEISKNNDIINDNTSFMNRYKEVSDLESAAETRADSKLTSKVFDDGSMGEALQKQRIEAQSNVDLAKSELDAATQAKDSVAIAAATSKLNNMQSALNRVKDKTKKEYISRVMSGEISDSNMLSNFNQTMSSISEFGSLFTDNSDFMTDFYNSTHNSDGTCKGDITDSAYNNFVDSIKSGQFSSNSSYGDCGYALLDAFEGISTNYRNKINLDVQKAQHANEAIEKSSAYRIAKQNRDAVGGQRK